jgi:hypothetical protein
MTEVNDRGHSVVREIGGEIDFGDNDKFNIPYMTDMRNLSIIVGANGASKTLIMKTTWFVVYSLNILKTIQLFVPEHSDSVFQAEVQKIFDLTFDTSDNYGCDLEIRGEVGCEYRMRLVIKDKKLINLDIEPEDPKKFLAHQMAMPLFLSKNTRTFKAYEQYLKMLEMNGLSGVYNHDDAYKLNDFFPLYDIMWLENVRLKLKDIVKDDWRNDPNNDIKIRGLTMVEDASSDLKDFKSFELKEEIPYVNYEDGRQKKLSALASGTQSMLMMILFS